MVLVNAAVGLFLEYISCRCMLTSFILLLNLSFLCRILETVTLFSPVFTDLASCIISFAITFVSLSLNKSPAWIIISASDSSCVGLC